MSEQSEQQDMKREDTPHEKTLCLDGGRREEKPIGERSRGWYKRRTQTETNEATETHKKSVNLV